MRRWNSWGDSATQVALNAHALAFLQAQVGAGEVAADATLEDVLAQIGPSRLSANPRWTIDAASRFRVSLGESYRDWICKRNGAHAPVPDAVAMPESSEQVRELLDVAQQANWIVIPFAGGTSVAGHLDCPVSERPVLSIDLGRMNQLLHFDPLSQLATFGAGTPGPLVEAQLRAHGYTLGHFPQSFELSTVGGWVVTRSSGQQSLRYGRIEALFAGGRLETPIGSLNIPTLPASSAGPDMRELVLGSEGRFGILTEVVVRATRLPEHESFHALFFPDWEHAEVAVRHLVQTRPALSMTRLSNGIETTTQLALAGHPERVRWLERYLGWRGCESGKKCMLMLGVTGTQLGARQTLTAARRLLASHGAVYVGPVMGKAWAQHRFLGPYLREPLWLKGFSVDTIETAVDWPRVQPLMLAMQNAAHDAFADFGQRVHAFTHLSHLYPQGSSIYSTFVWPTAAGGFEPNLQRWRHYKGRVSAAIAAAGGTVSHQHGVGRDHTAHLAAEKGALGMQTLAELCRHFDPQRIMNPGKLLADGESWAH